MRKYLTIAACLLCVFAAKAQNTEDITDVAKDAAIELSKVKEEIAPVEKPKYWSNSVTFNLGANMTNLSSNWAAGGYNTSNLNTNIDILASYSRKLMKWNNRLQLDYGFLNSSEKEGILQKTNDRIYLESKWSYRTSANSKWSFTASWDFRSQFTDTPEKYSQDAAGVWGPEGLKSGLLSPAYTNVALGIAWDPNKWFDINIAPLTGGYTIVTNPILRQSYGIDPDKSSRFQFGAQIKTDFKVVINGNISFESQAVVFTDYTNEPYFRINWDNAINWKLSKLINVSFKTWMINDPLVVDVNNLDESGNPTKVGSQWKEFLSFNFTYNLNWKK